MVAPEARVPPQLTGLARAGARTARTLLAPASLRGIAVEAGWLAAHVASYPFGLTSGRRDDTRERYTTDGLSPVHRGLLVSDVEAAGTPILLVHGLVDNRSVFTLLRRALRRRGFGRVWAVNYHVLTQDVRAAAARLAETVERVCAETGYERIHVVGHSLGGVIARYYVQRLGGDERVHTLVTLGSPHAGTRTARLLPGGICRQLGPDSDVVAELREPAPGCRTRFVAFYSDIDALMSPQQCARVDHPDLRARNLLVRGVGHTSLPIDGRVTREIAATLAQLDPGGATIASGLARLPGPAAEAAERPGTGPAPRRRARAAGDATG
jgi:pimeloyl-ACP methyl ester carboxylesterase